MLVSCARLPVLKIEVRVVVVLLHEDTQTALIVDLNELLTAIGRLRKCQYVLFDRYIRGCGRT
jgi:hypothetical protein